MFLETATATGDPASARSEGSLFITCPKLIGGTFRYARDEEIYGEAGEAKFVYKVVSGAVRSHKLLSDGRRQIGAFHLPGDVFGLESGSAHRLTAEAVVDTQTLIFDRSAVEYFALRDIEAARELWRLAARDLDHAVDHMLLLGRKTALERVADFLLEMDARMRPSGAIGLPMLRRDIADYLGLTLETVSRFAARGGRGARTDCGPRNPSGHRLLDRRNAERGDRGQEAMHWPARCRWSIRFEMCNRHRGSRSGDHLNLRRLSAPMLSRVAPTPSVRTQPNSLLTWGPIHRSRLEWPPKLWLR